MKGKVLGLGLLAVSMIGAVTGCGSTGSASANSANGMSSANNSSSSSSSSGKTMNIGVILPFTGPAAGNGKDVFQGMQVGADEVNSSGGVLGSQINLDQKDDQSTPSVGVNMVNSLLQDNVKAILEGFDSPVTQAEEPVIARNNLLDEVVVSKSVNFQYPNVIAYNSDNTFDGQAMGKFIQNNLQAKKVAIIYENDSYGTVAVDATTSVWKGSGAPQVVVKEGIPFSATSFTQELAKVKAANPDVLYVVDAAMASGLPDMIQQIHQQGINAKVVAAVGTIVPSVVKLAGNQASQGVYSADMYFPSTQNEQNTKFVQDYKAKYGSEPDKLAFLGYESVTLMAQAMNKAGTTDPSKVSSLIKSQSWDTAGGTMKFNSNGRQLSQYRFFQVKSDGSFNFLN
ncbi:ABC transporter substrate-binding protein [Alicyclobacillus dauci]|uniref:ABC transporter substrate-binding protein n=1 Tax=Alicyclobacillus dauci TaxID=1475485 RepID=A0ABY6Z0Y8_9BACL|nr:ABC transporter substrate-binding protein [Alicyclobacillus dauci]WAH36198.1 ABC transporter substrate-binding protein [Alicyclobacillus dauci]